VFLRHARHAVEVEALQQALAHERTAAARLRTTNDRLDAQLRQEREDAAFQEQRARDAVGGERSRGVATELEALHLDVHLKAFATTNGETGNSREGDEPRRSEFRLRVKDREDKEWQGDLTGHVAGMMATHSALESLVSDMSRTEHTKGSSKKTSIKRRREGPAKPRLKSSTKTTRVGESKSEHARERDWRPGPEHLEQPPQGTTKQRKSASTQTSKRRETIPPRCACQTTPMHTCGMLNNVKRKSKRRAAAGSAGSAKQKAARKSKPRKTKKSR
jgi:hypothetical protein